MTDSMSPTEYEEVVRALVDSFGQVFGTHTTRGGNSNLILGASGFEHQIDVSFHLRSALVLLECKLLKRPVAVDDALTLAARLIDIRAENPSLAVTASLVSRKSVTAGALKIADYFGFTIDHVLSLEEYVVTLRDRHFVGVQSGFAIGDSCSAE